MAGGTDDAFGFIGDEAFSYIGGELRFTASEDRLMVEGDTNGDGVTDQSIAVGNLTDLTTGDFVLQTVPRRLHFREHDRMSKHRVRRFGGLLD